MSMHRLLFTLLLWVVAVCPAMAQSRPAAQGDRAASKPDADGIAARAIVRNAMADLKLQSNPQTQEFPDERDFRITAELLEIAWKLVPDDADILRLLIQAWTSAGDADRVDALNRELLKLDPRDTVTQLAIISARISRLQNADERLASYERFLGPEGEKIDAAIRSRLALDAALLKRERGDEADFSRLLAEACRLDATNKDAATLALAYFVERVPDAVGRFELLINVLKSDPFDPEVHAAMAEELASAGAVKGAKRFYDTLARLRQARGEQMTPQETAEAVVADWNISGADAIVRQMTDNIESQRADLRARRERLATAGNVLQEVKDPMEVRLAMPFERTRVVASAAIGNPELVGYALIEAEESVRRLLEMLSAPEVSGRGASEEELAVTRRSLREELTWLRVWAGRTTDKAAQELEQLRQDPETDKALIARVEACLKMRQGQHDEAEAALIELAKDDVLAELALGILDELRNRPEAAVQRYTELSNRLGGSIAGAYCRTRVLQMTGRAPAPTEIGRKLQALADEVPVLVEAMINDPRRFVELRVDVVETEMRPLDKIQLRFTLENTSRLFPLAVGPDKPINSRFLLSPVVDVGVQRLSVPGLQEVIWLNRRLRLMPGERFEATVWADTGILGGILERVVGTTARTRWRVVQGFKLNNDGYYEPGALCLATETATVTRPAITRASADIPMFASWIENGTAREMAESILSFISLVSAPAVGGPQVTPQDITAIAQATANRFTRGERAEKMLLLMLCPSSSWAPPFSALDLEAGRDTDDDVIKCYLAMRVAAADSPQLGTDAWLSRPGVQAYANVLRTRLAEGAKTFATVGVREDDAAAPGGPPTTPPRGR